MKALRLVLALIIAFAPAVAFGDSGCFYKQKVYQQVYAQAIVQPYYVAPVAYYQAGQDVVAEALAEKVMRLVDTRITQALRVAPQQQHQQRQTQPPVAAGVFAKCVNCHTGERAAGGLVLDGVTPVSCRTLYKFSRMFGQGKDIPPKMQAVVQGMTPAERGTMYDGLVDLVQIDEPEVLPPPPGGDLQ